MRKITTPKKWGLILIAAGIVAMLAAIGLLLYNAAETKHAESASQDVLKEMSETSFDVSTDVETALSVAMVDGYPYIGVVSLPTLGIRLPVMDDWDYVRLKLAPCRYYGAPKTDDFVIAGHNYPTHFGRLSELKIGDEVTFTEMDGTFHRYKVGDIETLNPGQTQTMLESDWDLTLYTCTYSRTQRVTVRCERVSGGSAFVPVPTATATATTE